MDYEAKLCAGAWGFRRLGIAEYLDACGRLGFRYAEVNLTDSPDSKHLSCQPSSGELKEMAGAEKDCGVKIVCLCAGNDFTVSQPDGIRDEIEKCRRYVDVAADCGIGIIRLFGGWAPFPELGPDTWTRCAGALGGIGEYAQDRGVLVALENHGGITATAAQVCRLLEMTGHPNVKANFDGGNFAHCREDPYAAYQILRGRIGYTHWKDVRPAGDELEYCALGDGVTDWAPVIRAFVADGYDGFWTMEYEEPSDVEEGTMKCLNVVREQLGSPA